VVGNRIMVKGKIDAKFKTDDKISFIIESIEPLQEIKKKIKSISLRVSVWDLDDELIENILSFTDENQGAGVQLNFVVYDPAEKVWVELEAKTMKLNVTSDLFEYIAELRAADKEIDYKFN
jgi:DNA polymerase-3 subunit alpha